ncbi:MATE family efflux transporter [uncultured Oscillibacter sp.]|uniref:MATE family efflux transporter n=1 Tax=uncultured Oscillibacter sp. TaxID=876091 RepID=UPI0026077D3D|nr:MATE family efflux transporter [uncultured Oscillibacter sp.]
MDDHLDEKQEQKFRQMTETPVSRLICRLALPCIISMLVTSFYNMADTFFVGMLKSNSATGAVGVVFSLMAIIQAVGFFFGHGSGNFISRELGKQNFEEASNMAATGFFSALAAGTAICVLGQLFLEPLAMLLGSTATILPYTKAYLRVILFGAPWMTASLVLNNQLRYQGSAAYAMVGIASGAVLNIGLDPLLIFNFGLGVAGAAWATIISQFVSFCLLLAGCSKGGNLHIHISRVQLKLPYYVQIVRGGLPSLARQGLASVAAICLNRAAGPYGDAAIAAMGVVQRIMMFGGSAMIGFGQGFQPVCGFNYGAKLYHRVKQGFWFCVKASFGFLLAVSALGFAFAPRLVALFRDDRSVIEIGAMALRFQCATLCLSSWIVMSNMMLQTIGKTAGATFIAMSRQGIFFIPLVYVLSRSLGLLGVEMTQSAADVLTLLCTVPIQLRALREMDVLESTQSPP